MWDHTFVIHKSILQKRRSQNYLFIILFPISVCLLSLYITFSPCFLFSLIQTVWLFIVFLIPVSLFHRFISFLKKINILNSWLICVALEIQYMFVIGKYKWKVFLVRVEQFKVNVKWKGLLYINRKEHSLFTARRPRF